LIQPATWRPSLQWRVSIAALLWRLLQQTKEPLVFEEPRESKTAKKWPSGFKNFCKLAAQAGIEPVLALLQACVAAAASEFAANPDAQLRAQKPGELQEIVAAWPELSPELRTAVLAVNRVALFSRAVQCTVLPEFP
jgi:hypothetical protein